MPHFSLIYHPQYLIMTKFLLQFYICLLDYLLHPNKIILSQQLRADNQKGTFSSKLGSLKFTEDSMSEYQLEIKQIVDYPRCRVYRQFIQNLMDDRSIRTNGGSGLFYYTVLCNYANFRTSYRRIDGIGYTVYPGEWICTVKELSAWFRTRLLCQAVSILDELQKRHLISYLFLDRGKVIKYKIRDWKKHNTVLDYNCPCQKDTGFFFMPVVIATELVSNRRCSEMDILLDLWLSAIYNDNQVQGSEIGPVVYFRTGTGSPLVTYNEAAARWGISKATAGRVLNKLADKDYISLMSFPGRTGSVIYLQNYLSTMFQISDVLVDKEEVAMVLNIHITLPDDSAKTDAEVDNHMIEHEVCVSEELSSVSKLNMAAMIEKMAQVLDAQGISCFQCPKSIYKLYPLSDVCREEYISGAKEANVRLGMTVSCGNDKPVYSFELFLTPVTEKAEGGNRA